MRYIEPERPYPEVQARLLLVSQREEIPRVGAERHFGQFNRTVGREYGLLRVAGGSIPHGDYVLGTRVGGHEPAAARVRRYVAHHVLL